MLGYSCARNIQGQDIIAPGISNAWIFLPQEYATPRYSSQWDIQRLDILGANIFKRSFRLVALADREDSSPFRLAALADRKYSSPFRLAALADREYSSPFRLPALADREYSSPFRFATLADREYSSPFP